MVFGASFDATEHYGDRPWLDRKFRELWDDIEEMLPAARGALWRKPHRAGECVYSAIEITCQFAAISQIDPVSRLVWIEDGGTAKMPYCGGAIIQIPLISQSKTIMDGSIVFIESQTPHQVRDIVRARTLRLLTRIQPESGGFLEATPLTSFVVMSLIGAE